MSIEVRNLSKQFGTFAALRDVSWRCVRVNCSRYSVLQAPAKPRCYA